MQYKNHYAVWLLVFAMILSLALTGCGKSETAEDAETVSETAEEAEPEATTQVLEIDAVEGILNVTLLVNESEDGTQSVAGAAIEYNSNIDAASLSTSDYSVVSNDTEYNVSDVYTNSEAAFADESTEGCYVILVLTENAQENIEQTEEKTEDTVTETVDEPAVTPYVIDGEEEVILEGPEGWDSDTAGEAVVGGSPQDAASGELGANDGNEDSLTISVTQMDTVFTVDQEEIGPSPVMYESTAVVVA